MADMRLSEVDRKEMVAMPSKGPKYPYGLCITLGPEEIEKLGISEAPEIGKSVKFMAIAKVKSVSSREEDGDHEGYEIRLQIEDMELEKAKKESVVDVLYRGE